MTLKGLMKRLGLKVDQGVCWDAVITWLLQATVCFA